MSKQHRLTLEQKQQILQLLSKGGSRKEVATHLGISWQQVNYWYDKQARVVELVYTQNLKFCDFGHAGSNPASGTNYAYLLGCYLGDGYISKQGKYTYRIRIACDVQYPEIITEIKTALASVTSNNVNVAKTKSNAVDVFSYSCHLPRMFPQHGVGRKHTRRIELAPWQKNIIDQFPEHFLRGLYHTDGSRYQHKYVYNTKTGNKLHETIKYNFTNRSEDIIDLFCSTCDRLDIKWTKCTRPFINLTGACATGWTVTIGRRSEVAKLDTFLGPKS